MTFQLVYLIGTPPLLDENGFLQDCDEMRDCCNLTTYSLGNCLDQPLVLFKGLVIIFFPQDNKHLGDFPGHKDRQLSSPKKKKKAIRQNFWLRLLLHSSTSPILPSFSCPSAALQSPHSVTRYFLSPKCHMLHITTITPKINLKRFSQFVIMRCVLKKAI